MSVKSDLLLEWGRIRVIPLSRIRANVFVAHVDVIIFHTAILFLPNWYLVEYMFPFKILRFLTQNHQAFLKDRFLKKMC